LKNEKTTLYLGTFAFKKIHMKTFDSIITILLIIGGLNWGLVGLFEFDLVQYIFGQGAFARIVYTVVGLSAICKVFLWNMGETTE
jgi:uncharacterized membrane protein YuzA (DUF378 family)